MHKLKKILSPRKLAIILGLSLIFFSISFINEPSQSITEGIVTLIAIDYSNEKIDLACSVITPKNSTEGTTAVFTAQGETIAEAVELIGLQTGKELGFAQCDVVAVGDNIAEIGVIDALDYFTRAKRVGRNVLLLNFSGKPSEFAESVAYLDDNLSLSLADILDYNREYLLAVNSNIENFYLGYYSDSGVAPMPKFNLLDEETIGAVRVELKSVVTDNSQSEQGGDGSINTKMRYLKNDGTTSIIKDGIKVSELSPSEIKKINLFEKESKYGTFRVENITGKFYKNATVLMNLENKDVSTNYDFKNGVPTIKAKIKVYVKINEIDEEGKNQKLLRREDELLTSEVNKKLKQKITEDLMSAMDKMKSENLDLVNIYENFNKFHYKKWGKYINKVGTDNYLSDIDLKVEVKIAQLL